MHTTNTEAKQVIEQLEARNQEITERISLQASGQEIFQFMQGLNIPVFL